MTTITAAEQVPSFPRQISNSYWKGHRFASEGAYWGLPIVALEVATAKRGEMVPTLLGKTAGLAIQPVASGLASAALTFSLGLPPAAAALAATVLVGYATSQMENTLIRGLTTLSRVGRDEQRVRFGGGYVDTQSAQQRRQRAATELAGAMPVGRRWLGQEALFLHR
jgi:hypothetical protein